VVSLGVLTGVVGRDRDVRTRTAREKKGKPTQDFKKLITLKIKINAVLKIAYHRPYATAANKNQVHPASIRHGAARPHRRALGVLIVRRGSRYGGAAAFFSVSSANVGRRPGPTVLTKQSSCGISRGKRPIVDAAKELAPDHASRRRLTS